VGPRAGLVDVEKSKFLTLPGLELRSLGRPARCQSLCRLRYPGSTNYMNTPYFLNLGVIHPLDVITFGKFPECYCCKCLGERRRERRPRSHFHKPIASVCHVTPRCDHALFLQEFFFDFVFSFVCDGRQNRATRLPQVLREVR
jgi:hypothetical protein